MALLERNGIKVTLVKDGVVISTPLAKDRLKATTVVTKHGVTETTTYFDEKGMPVVSSTTTRTSGK